jgi:Flp pilus assembly protein TadG
VDPLELTMAKSLRMPPLRCLLSDDTGAAAAEFALIIPGLVLMSVGASYLVMMMWASSALHYATEDAARCASVRPTTCTSAGVTQTYAATRYTGPGTPTFTATSPACGKQVAATLAYSLNTGLARISVPLSATACYPLP